MPKPKLPFATGKPRQYYDSRTYRRDRRTFSNETKRLAWKRSKNHCEACEALVTGAADIEFDHIVAWELTHDSSLANCQVLCKTCHANKTAGRDVPAIAQADRKRDFHLGITGPGRGKSPLPCGRASSRSKSINHGIVPRLTQREKHRRFMAQRYFSERGV